MRLRFVASVGVLVAVMCTPVTSRSTAEDKPEQTFARGRNVARLMHEEARTRLTLAEMLHKDKGDKDGLETARAIELECRIRVELYDWVELRKKTLARAETDFAAGLIKEDRLQHEQEASERAERALRAVLAEEQWQSEKLAKERDKRLKAARK